MCRLHGALEIRKLTPPNPSNYKGWQDQHRDLQLEVTALLAAPSALHQTALHAGQGAPHPTALHAGGDPHQTTHHAGGAPLQTTHHAGGARHQIAHHVGGARTALLLEPAPMAGKPCMLRCQLPRNAWLLLSRKEDVSPISMLMSRLSFMLHPVLMALLGIKGKSMEDFCRNLA
eukprot:1147588-Pelagomonas_calceolata.AAC.5